jgi:hypothetical protein
MSGVAIGFAVIGALVAFQMLAVLGLIREVARYRLQIAGFSHLVTNPPAPSFVGSSAPPLLVAALEDAPVSSNPQLVVFVSPRCGSCGVVLSALASAIRRNEIDEENVLFVVWAFPESDWRTYAEKLPSRYTVDLEGTLSRACEVRGTPTMFIVSPDDDYRVVGFNAKGDTTWAINEMTLSPLTIS